MKLLTTLVLSLSAAAVHAEPVDVLSSYRVGGSFYRASAGLHEYNPEAFNEVKSVGSCAEALTVLKNTDEPTIAIWDYLSHEIAENDACKIDDDMFITNYVATYLNICSTKAEYDLDYLLNNPVKVGVSRWYTARESASKILENIGSPAILVTYKTSRDYDLALEIGEIDYVYTHQPTEKMFCALSNDPNSVEVKHTGEIYDHPFAEMGNNIAIVGVNVDKDEVQALIIDAGTNGPIANTSAAVNNDFSKLSRKEQLDYYRSLVSAFR
jgi:hypothetical protein